MNKQQTLAQIFENPLIAILRKIQLEELSQVIETLIEGRIYCIEITATTPEFVPFLKKVAKLRDSHAIGKKIILGAGTVLDEETTRIAILSGAQFIFSPTYSPRVIESTLRYGAISIPGCLTPTEILQAQEHGSDIIKLFPAHTVGPKYIQSIMDSIGEVPIFATGGIHLENLSEYYHAGAQGFGLGNSLISPIHSSEKLDRRLTSLKTKAQNFVSQMQELKNKLKK